MPSRIGHHLVLSLCGLAALSPSAWAQAAPASGGIEGRVLDRFGRPVAVAAVSVVRGTQEAAQAVTDATGVWRVAPLEPGIYQVRARRLGYQPAVQRVQVEPDRVARLTMTLEPAPLALDTVVVQGFTPGIGARPDEVGSRLGSAEIALLPTTADVRQLIALTPGARPDQIWGGASDQANLYTLDGTPVNHAGLGGAFFLPSPSWVETLEIRGLGAGADAPGTQGGLVEVTTRSGRNAWEGGLWTSFESHRLNESNLIANEIGRELARRWEADGQVRGPLIQDRLHLALFGHVRTQDDMVLSYLPATGQFVAQPPSQTEYHGLTKLTWKPGTRDLLRFSLMGRHQQGERTGQTGYEDAVATERLRQWTLTGNLSWQRSWSARSAITIGLGGYVAAERHDPYSGAATPGIEPLIAVNAPRFQNAPFRSRGIPSSYGLTAAWTWPARVAGIEHDMKVGGEYALGAWGFQRRRNGGMTWRPRPVQGFDPRNPATWYYSGAVNTAWGGEVRLDSHTETAAIFAQDHIAVRDWLRVNPGVRWGTWSGALTPAGGRRITMVRDKALELRVGLVADLDANSGLVAKAHWGRYHQPMFAALFDRVAGANAYSNEEIWAYLGPPPATPTDVFTLAARDSLAARGLFRQEQIDQLDQAGRVENYRQPYVDQAVVAVERSVGARWKATIAYVHRRNHNMVALVDRNLDSNYTVVQNVIVRDRFQREIIFDGQPLVLEQLAISNEDILWVQELLRQGLLVGGNVLFAPPSLTPAQLAALRYAPDYVLTTVPAATRGFGQLQLRVDARYPAWWLTASATFTKLEGNFNVVTGPDDYTTGGPGPWVRLNEQFGFSGALNNQSGVEGKLAVGGLLPWRLRGGAFLSYATGDRVTPLMLISGLLTDYALALPRISNPAVIDTVSFHSFLFRSTSGHRVFLRPRGTYRHEARTSLDLHVERTFPRGRSEVVLTVDAFNVLADRSVTAKQMVVNTGDALFGTDYGQVRGRIPPRTLRLGAGLRF